MRTLLLIAAVGAAVMATACAPARVAPDPAYVREIEQWRADREARLKTDDGWLTLVGLFWLNEGSSTIGSDPSSDVPLPPALPARVGTLTRKGSEVRFAPAMGVALQATVLRDDEQSDHNVLQLGTVRFYLVHRGDRYGIRVKDTQSPARVNFAGLDWYPPDPTWNVTATLTSSPHEVMFDTEVGLQQHDDSPGYLEFDREGVHYKLDAVDEDGELFLVMRDATSGKTTYAASRFLYAPLPDAQGHTRLDFNKAYNPPCVFTAYATCPLPPQMNRLKTPIEAGEKKYKEPTL